MIIAQISDLHVHVEGNYAYGVVNTIPMIQQAVEHLNQLDPRPDVVVATGDLTHHGELAEYKVLRQLLAPLKIPLYLLPGNHDRQQP
ncbi:MAG: metallophosphoesterase, partial [Phormidesmis sp.]